MKRRFIAIIVFVLIIATIWFIERNQKQATIITDGNTRIETGIVKSAETSGNDVGSIAPDWQLQSFDGKLIRLSEMRGSPVLIDFFADWCPFCHSEFPFIEAAYQKYKDDGLVVIGVHRTDTESKERGERFARKEAGATFILVEDRGGDVYGAYTSGPAMPISFFIDRSGVIQDTMLGPKTEEMLKEGIHKIIGIE